MLWTRVFENGVILLRKEPFLKNISMTQLCLCFIFVIFLYELG